MAATKRKRSSVQATDTATTNGDMPPPPIKRRQSTRNSATAAIVNPDVNGEVLDAPSAARASPDADMNREIIPGQIKQENGVKEDSPLSPPPEVVEQPKENGRGRKNASAKKVREAEVKVAEVVDAAENHVAPPKKGRGKAKDKQQNDENGVAPVAPEAKATAKKKATDEGAFDPEAEGSDAEAGEEEVTEALSRPPPVNSSYLPLPWKGRLGYACLNTYLRMSNPPVFSSRTCRIQSILEHRHPLQDPLEPEHPTKNKPDRNKPADVELGKRYVEALCLANVKDIIKMVRWNERYGIKFFRLSSEMFPFASHSEYGYKLAPFASEALAEAGKVIAELGHRVTTHPGQFTQLGSPRKPVIENAIRDLEYHDEMLSLLKLPEQADKDAVMILHMGGVFEGKAETLARFKENYAILPQSIKNRLVLENDDVSWTVHDLLSVCEELNIPFVLDYHHHNIMFDSTQIREGTHDIQQLYPRILATWERKGIKPKMHYSEQTPPAITGRQRRKHSPRVMTLPPCPPDMDLMIEAKDKEQAVFELMKTFKLPGWDTFNDVVPYTRRDDNKVASAELAKQSRKSAKKKKNAEAENDERQIELISDDEVGMGGPEGRVYWPPGMEEWLRPKKREVKKKEPADDETEKKKAAKVKKEAAEAYAAREAEKAKANGTLREEDGEDSDEAATPATKKAKAAMKKKAQTLADKAAGTLATGTNGAVSKRAGGGRKKAPTKPVKTEEESMSDGLSDLSSDGEDAADEQIVTPAKKRGSAGRAAKSKRVSYAEDEDVEMEGA